MRAASIIPSFRALFPPSPTEAHGPTHGREQEVHIDGLTWASCEDMEPRIVQALRAALIRRFGDARLERRYAAMGGPRVGYVTYVRDSRDTNWLRLFAALLAQRAGLPDGTVRVRVPAPSAGAPQ